MQGNEESQVKKAVASILALSFLILAFLLWIIYSKKNLEHVISWTANLPPVNTALNALTAVFLIAGFSAIKKKQRKRHIRLMCCATMTSFFFLIGYILYHYGHGETAFLGQGWIRPVYFFILISHIFLSALQLPLILITHFFALTKRFSYHKKIAKYTFPIWLYVSITGVLIFILLKLYN